MKLLYSASNAIEAHMILDLLEQAGLSARIDGEYLQGGVGELQAIGIVRVMIDENDFVDAYKIIREWDSTQPEQEVQPTTIKTKSSSISTFLGFACGVAVTFVYFSTPVTEDGIDYNGDGRLDEKWTYVNYRPSKTVIDRNFDGKTDSIYLFDSQGLLKTSSSDDDFNGTFETDIYYEYGSAVWQKSDTTGDGYKDYITNFKYGLIDTITFFDSVTQNAVKVQSFGKFKLKSAKIDTSGDGVLDASYEYDSVEEIVKQSNKSL